MILDETLKKIKTKIQFDQIKIKNIFLSNYFNVVQLDNSSIGACMNFFHFKSEQEAHETRDILLRKVKSDPLLLKYLCRDKSCDLLKLNLKTCLISALSKNLILSSSQFHISRNHDCSIFAGINSATVIGYGGYVDFIIRNTDITRIHISDLSYNYIKNEINKGLFKYKRKYPLKKITASNGIDNKKKIASSDLVSITGSAFCNGTMDELLNNAKNCPRIIIQGQSASIYPEILFKKGVKLITTTIKPYNLLRIAVKDFQTFKYLLEGRLPWIYITPK